MKKCPRCKGKGYLDTYIKSFTAKDDWERDIEECDMCDGTGKVKK